MVQQTLVEYIKSQLKLGVGKDEVKSALISAGWPEADVDDSFKSMEGTAPQAASPAPTVTDGSPVKEEQKPKEDIAFSYGKMSGGISRSKPIVVGDLVGGVKPGFNATETIKKEEKESPEKNNPTELKREEPKKEEKKPDQKNVSEPVKVGSSSTPSKSKLSKNLTVMIVLGVLVAGFATASVWLYIQNHNLNEKIIDLSGEDVGLEQAVGERVVEMSSEIESLSADLLLAQEESELFKTELSFVAPLNLGKEKIEIDELSAVVHKGGDDYLLTTLNGVEITVSNSADKDVIFVLGPLVGETVVVSGVYIAGVAEIELTAINGSAVSSEDDAEGGGGS